MSVDVTFWYGFIAALLVLGALVGWLARTRRLPATSGEYGMARERMAQEITELRSTVSVLQRDHVNDAQRITQLEKEQSETKQELAQAKQEIRHLKGRLAQYETEEPAVTNLQDFPLLAIFGADDTITTTDLAAIRQSGIPFRRILKATKQLIAEELLRRREAGDLYRWLHVGTHAGPVGMELADGLAEPLWWNEWLSGIEGVFLAGCTDVKVADWLIGCVGWVLSTYENVDNDLAGRFTRAFWSAMHDGKGKGARECYKIACASVPQFREYTDFRMRPG